MIGADFFYVFCGLTMSTEEIVVGIKVHIEELKGRFGLASLYLYGSYALDEQGEGSDIDLM